MASLTCSRMIVKHREIVQLTDITRLSIMPFHIDFACCMWIYDNGI